MGARLGADKRARRAVERAAKARERRKLAEARERPRVTLVGMAASARECQLGTRIRTPATAEQVRTARPVAALLVAKPRNIVPIYPGRGSTLVAEPAGAAEDRDGEQPDVGCCWKV